MPGKRGRVHAELIAVYGAAVPRPPGFSDSEWTLCLLANMRRVRALRAYDAARSSRIASAQASPAELIELAVDAGEDEQEATIQILMAHDAAKADAIAERILSRSSAPAVGAIA